MRRNLFKSFLVVGMFWWTVLFFLWVYNGLTDSVANTSFYQLLLSLGLIEESSVARDVSRVSDLVGVFSYWVYPSLIVSGLFYLLGLRYAAHKSKFAKQELEDRIKPETGWRGVKITLGVIPKQEFKPSVDKVELPLDEEIILRSAEEEIKLLNEMLSIIKAHETHYAGPDTEEGLLDHTLGILEEALAQPQAEALSLITAIAPELAKTHYYYKKFEKVEVPTEGWPKVKYKLLKKLDKLPAPSYQWDKLGLPFEKAVILTLSSLESWWTLKEESRLGALYAIKFKSKPQLLPNHDKSGPVFQKAQHLLGMARELNDELEEKVAEQVISKVTDPSELVYKAFLDTLSTSTFQQPGTARALKAIGWKRDGLLFLLEDQVREKVKAKLDESFLKGLKKKFPKKPSLGSVTVCLLDHLNNLGLLVTSKNGIECTPDRALFKIRAGKNEFNGVLIVKLNEDLLSRCPSINTTFQIEVLESFFKGTATGEEITIKQDEFLGTLLRGDIPVKKEREKPKLVSQAQKAGKYSEALNGLLNKTTV